MFEKSLVTVANDRVKHLKKDWGIFFTPDSVVKFMISLIDRDLLKGESLKILEPACGICQFLEGVRRYDPTLFTGFVKRVGVEINGELIEFLHQTGLKQHVEIVHGDFLRWETEERFDVILGNPPYGIPSLSEHYTIRVDSRTKKIYKQIYETWHGKYNVYGAFIEKSIRLLKENGQLIFIVPATFMILDEFKKLRRFLSFHGKTQLIYMGSGVFKPEADVTTVILKFIKSKFRRGRLILYDFEEGRLREILTRSNWNGEIILFSTDFTRAVDGICTFRLGDLYEIRISPRTPEIKKSKDVVRSDTAPDENFLPILNGRNLKIGKVVYEPLSGYWIARDRKTVLRKFFDKPHMVVGLGFRGSKRLGCAYDSRAYPWMGDVYHLLRKHTLTNRGFDLSEEEMVSFLNSELVDRYIREVFRDITYHFSITQLKVIPVPTREELVRLKELLR